MIRAAVVHYSIKVAGKVHGVFFRASTRNIAINLDIVGTVRNEKDGTVRIEAEGNEEQLAKLVKWCNEGPEHAEVESVSFEQTPVIGYEGFDIIR